MRMYEIANSTLHQANLKALSVVSMESKYGVDPLES